MPPRRRGRCWTYSTEKPRSNPIDSDMTGRWVLQRHGELSVRNTQMSVRASQTVTDDWTAKCDVRFSGTTAHRFRVTTGVHQHPLSDEEVCKTGRSGVWNHPTTVEAYESSNAEGPKCYLAHRVVLGLFGGKRFLFITETGGATPRLQLTATRPSLPWLSARLWSDSSIPDLLGG